MLVWEHLDVEQEYVEEDNRNILEYVSSYLGHVHLVDGKTSEDSVDIAME
jgi:hypothetical protein